MKSLYERVRDGSLILLALSAGAVTARTNARGSTNYDYPLGGATEMSNVVEEMIRIGCQKGGGVQGLALDTASTGLQGLYEYLKGFSCSNSTSTSLACGFRRKGLMLGAEEGIAEINNGTICNNYPPSHPNLSFVENLRQRDIEERTAKSGRG